ncbi:MAG TPA: hypothetical protein VES95_10420 [Dermatophilaceae bacterium]|nr:hypothetical protein [Dermatophilaceae bacterium]
MPQTRVYVPLDPAGVATLRHGGSIGPPPIPAHAVTSRQGRPGLTTDVEELEHAAWSAAAAAAGGRVSGHAPRVVASADVDSGDVVEVGGPEATEVRVRAPVALRDVVSFHVDEVPGGPDRDLLWFDVTELDDVLALVESRGPVTRRHP